MRLQKIEPAPNNKIDAGDLCYHLGEYTAGGGFGVSETNQQILNFKKRPTVSAAQLRYKQAAICYWADKLSEAVNFAEMVQGWTLVPAPASKLVGDPDYDDRTLRLLLELQQRHDGLDVRQLVVTCRDRLSQHEGGRMDVSELQATMEVNPRAIATPLKPNVLVVDDVFTLGATFKAMKNLMVPLPGVVSVPGLFLARTIWPQPDFAAIFENLEL